MSYVLTPYMIDFARLRDSIGGGDKKIIAAIRRKVGKQFDADDDGLSLGRAVTDLIMDTPRGRIATHQYGYGLEAIADRLGKRLPKDCWSGVSWAAVADAGLRKVMKRGAPVKLPKYPDFPMVGFMERAEVVEVAAKLSAKPLMVKDRSLQGLIDEYSGWLDCAANSTPGGLDLLFFYY